MTHIQGKKLSRHLNLLAIEPLRGLQYVFAEVGHTIPGKSLGRSLGVRHSRPLNIQKVLVKADMLEINLSF